MSFMCLKMAVRRRLYDLFIDPAANEDVTIGSSRILETEGRRSWQQLVLAHALATRGDANGSPTDIIELRFFFCPLSGQGHYGLSREHGFYRKSFDDSIYHKGMDSAKWNFSISTKHDALQRICRLRFLDFHPGTTTLCLSRFRLIPRTVVYPRPSPNSFSLLQIGGDIGYGSFRVLWKLAR